MPRPLRLGLAEANAHAEYSVSNQSPVASISCSCGRLQCRLLAGFSRNPPRPLSPEHPSACRIVGVDSSLIPRLQVVVSPPGSGHPAAVEGPSSHRQTPWLGISQARDLVEQSRAAAMKAHCSNCGSKLACLLQSERSRALSINQSTCNVGRPSATEEESLRQEGTDPRHEIRKKRGLTSPFRRQRGKTCCPESPVRGPSGELQALVFTVQPGAPWLAELHVLCPLVTTPISMRPFRAG